MGKRIMYDPPPTRYVVKFTVPEGKDPYVGLLEAKVKFLDARVAELEAQRGFAGVANPDGRDQRPIVLADDGLIEWKEWSPW
jgi:hypothetical protein